MGLFISIVLLLGSSVTLGAGQSVKKMPAPDIKRWSIEGGLSYKHGTKEGAETILLQEASVGYEFPAGWSLGVAEAYQSPLSVYEDEKANWGLEDLEIAVSKALGAGWSLNFKNILPTSQTSQKASMKFAATLGASYSYRYKSISLALVADLYGYAYEFDSVDQDGSDYNSPWAQYY
ncbi:MAG: hypothetical protein ABL958_12930, partial [Bdellovibrionia bacterium]